MRRRRSKIHDIATVMATNGFGEIAHASIVQSSSQVSDDASDRGCREFLVIPHIPQQIKMGDVLVWPARQSVQQSKVDCVAEVQRATLPQNA